MATRREKGLCYNCDERFTPNHRCKSRCFLIIAEEDDAPGVGVSPLDNMEPLSPTADTGGSPSAQLSLNAMSGNLAPETLRVTGMVGGQEVVILIDRGSTHNFVQDKMVRFLKLQAQPTKQLNVMVGNGSHLTCSHICKNIQVSIQGHLFHVDLHVMPIGGADLVFGVQWLKGLGPILTDYTSLKMTFSQNGQQIELQGRSGLGPTELTHHQVRRLLQTQRGAAYFHLQLGSDPSPFSLTSPQPYPPHAVTELPPPLNMLLTRFSPLFQ